MSVSAGKTKPNRSKTPPVPKPSASVLLISPTNQILLLHRVRTSSAFPSAHVFPGGNCDSFHDGAIPTQSDSNRHEDGEAYRMAAIRETFEESGILLANNAGFGRLIELEDEEREQGRKLVHSKELSFSKWLAQKGGRPDVDGLIPFTRWITPTSVPKRFTTQMYIYFLPVASTNSSTSSGIGSITSGKDALIPVPTPDGGIEHTAARFLPPSKWISMAQSGEIILFPPQFFLLHLISPFLSPENVPNIVDPEELRHQRQLLKEFLKTSDPPWAEKCISPVPLGQHKEDGRVMLGLDYAGPELEGSGRGGDSDRVVLLRYRKEGPREVEVMSKRNALGSGNVTKEKL